MRPLTDVERKIRRDDLADCAAELFAAVGYGRLTIEAVAKAAGVAKGTVFLAFASKEDLVLYAVGRRFDAWWGRLLAVDPSVSAGDLSRLLLGTITADSLLMPLLSLVGPVLEQGCSQEAVLRFKEGLAQGLTTLTDAWGSANPQVPSEAWTGLFQRIHALIVGAWAVGEASDTVRVALSDRPDLQRLLTRFEDLVVPMLEAQLRAILGE